MKPIRYVKIRHIPSVKCVFDGIITPIDEKCSRCKWYIKVQDNYVLCNYQKHTEIKDEIKVNIDE